VVNWEEPGEEEKQGWSRRTPKGANGMRGKSLNRKLWGVFIKIWSGNMYQVGEERTAGELLYSYRKDEIGEKREEEQRT